MATVKATLRNSTVPGKAGTICYQLTHCRQTRNIATSIRIPQGAWDDRRQQIAPRGAGPDLRQQQIDCDLELLRRIVRNLESEGRAFTVDEIAERFRSPRCRTTVLAFMRQRIAGLDAADRLGTARNYRRAYISFSRFLCGADLPFPELTEQLVNDYNRYLIRRGIVRNTISFYMRILRSVYNKAVRQHLVEQKFPFREVYTGIDRTRKRAVDEQTVARLARLELRPSSSLAFARDLFLFSFCTRGMAFVDMAYLREKDIRDGTIRYIRHKTGQQLTIRIEPCIDRIIRRYARNRGANGYLFPILKSDDPHEAYAQYQLALNYYNRLLKKLSAMLGLEHGLSSYTARHSWATAARNRNIPLSVISAGMGHASEKTTEIYLSLLENSVIDNANRQIVAVVGRAMPT